MEKTKKEAYDAGYNCGTKGANKENCHFTFFATKELSESHSKGVKDAKEDFETKEQLTKQK